jgi:heme/copper-type cytochrome/quinol oxidase subunit 2
MFDIFITITRSVTTTARRSIKHASKASLLALLIGVLPLTAAAAGIPEFALAIQNHRFDPATLKVPANTKFKLRVTNKDTTPSEFESNDFNREKVVLPGSTVTVFIGPLKPGQYKFFDDFHQDTGLGVLLAE